MEEAGEMLLESHEARLTRRGCRFLAELRNVARMDKMESLSHVEDFFSCPR